MSLISVIIPVYNVEQYIYDCLNSVVDQTYRRIEIILVDDGSTDRSGLICDEYRKKDQRIVVIHKDNGGLSDARNAGLDVAKGEYVFFLDSDDYIAKDAIEKMYSLLKDNNADMVIGNRQNIDASGENYLKTISPIINETLNNFGLLSKLLLPKSGYYVTAWNKLYKMSLFDSVRFPVGKIHEDEFVAHKIFFKCKKVISMQDVSYFYRKRDGSIMRQGWSVKRLDAAEALAERCVFLYDNGVDLLINKAFQKLFDYYYYVRKRYKKEYPERIGELDRLFKLTGNHCKKKLSFKSKLILTFPGIIICISKIKEKMSRPRNSCRQKDR